MRSHGGDVFNKVMEQMRQVHWPRRLPCNAGRHRKESSGGGDSTKGAATLGGGNKVEAADEPMMAAALPLLGLGHK